MKKIFKKNLLAYEIMNVIKDPSQIGFGVVFPIVFISILLPSIMQQIPDIAGAEKELIRNQFFIGYLIIGPLVINLQGLATSFAKEIETNCILRLNLFGYDNKQILCAKTLASIICCILVSALYLLIVPSIVDFKMPSWDIILFYGINLLLIFVLLFVFGYIIAMITRRSNVSLAITMFLYFFIMLVSGLFGITLDSFPDILTTISNGIPISFLVNDTTAIFTDLPNYNYAMLIQSYVISISVAIILLFYVFYKNKRR